jgi:hypothetical protein
MRNNKETGLYRFQTIFEKDGARLIRVERVMQDLAEEEQPTLYDRVVKVMQEAGS